jgi:hypothetical protein
MWCRGIGEEPLGVEDKELVYAVRQYLVFHLALNAAAGSDGM